MRKEGPDVSCPYEFILPGFDWFAIGGRQVAQFFDSGGDNLQRKCDVLLGCVAAKAEAEAGAGFFGRQADGRENVGRFDGSGGTGRAGGAGKPLEIESNEKSFAFNSGENKIRRVRSARGCGAVNTRLRDALEETLLQFVAQKRYALGVVCEGVARDFGRFAEADDASDVFGAGAEAALVMAAVE